MLENWLANLLLHFLDVPVGAWLSAGVVFALGVFLFFRYGDGQKLEFRKLFFTPEALWLLALSVLFTFIGRGLPIYDDFQNLPTVSLMAAGDVPPHFALNPDVVFGYHYFQLLVAAQISRLAGLFPAVALDISRGFFIASAALLGGKFIYRLTSSKLAEGLGIGLLLFSSGARWLFFLIPQQFRPSFDAAITLIGSGKASGTSLFDALYKPFAIEAGPIAFPFAFISGLNPPMVLWLGGISASAVVIVLLLLLLIKNRAGYPGLALIAVIVASLGLADEVWFLMLGAGVLVQAAVLLFRKDKEYRREVFLLVACFAASTVIALLQGGMLTELARGVFSRAAGSASATYFDTTFHLQFPPAFVSGHLGILSVFNFYQLIAVLFEFGVISAGVIVLPVVLAGSLRKQETGMAVLSTAGIISLLSMFVIFQGSGGVSSTTRLVEVFYYAGTLLLLPFCWPYLEKAGGFVRSLAVTVYFAAVLSGVVVFAISLAGIGIPTSGDFIRNEDLAVYQKYWNRLPADALIFDAWPERAPTIFGRPTRSSISWFKDDPEWLLMKEDVSVENLRSAGYTHVYFSLQDWEGLTDETRAGYKQPCVKLMEKLQVEDRGRRLFDISTCQ